MTYRLLPCPRCGKQPEQFGPQNAFRCPEGSACSAHGGWMSGDDWNARAVDLERLHVEAIKDDALRDCSQDTADDERGGRYRVCCGVDSDANEPHAADCRVMEALRL